MLLKIVILFVVASVRKIETIYSVEVYDIDNYLWTEDSNLPLALAKTGSALNY